MQGIGYATEGSTRGGGIFENGAELLAAPTISSGDTLSIEISIQDESLHHARFQINGQYITRPLDLSDMTTPFIPVVTLPANAAVRVGRYHFIIFIMTHTRVYFLIVAIAGNSKICADYTACYREFGTATIHGSSPASSQGV